MNKKNKPIYSDDSFENIANKKEQLDSSNSMNNEPSLSPYEIAIFKKRIMWKATIFALKIVIPVVILALILLKFNS